jgi:hypothetical protein
MKMVHNETSQERIRSLDEMIVEAEIEINRLRSEREALVNGETTLRNLGLERKLLYPLWKENLRTVEDVDTWLRKAPYGLQTLKGIGDKAERIILDALKKARGGAR